jgi:hypothetical protein
MDRTNQRALVQTLMVKSKAGELAWKPRSNENSFVVSLSKGGVIISKDIEDYETVYTISVVNSNGVTVDTFTDVDLTVEEALPVWNDRLAALFEMARRTALKSDEVLDGVLKELQGKR